MVTPIDKWTLIELLKEEGFSDSSLLDMFIYWESDSDVIACVQDFLQDRGLKLVNTKIVEI